MRASRKRNAYHLSYASARASMAPGLFQVCCTDMSENWKPYTRLSFQKIRKSLQTHLALHVLSVKVSPSYILLHESSMKLVFLKGKWNKKSLPLATFGVQNLLNFVSFRVTHKKWCFLWCVKNVTRDSLRSFLKKEPFHKIQMTTVTSMLNLNPKWKRNRIRTHPTKRIQN